MNTPQVARLQALLQRVQDNRGKPRPGHAAVAAAPISMPVAAAELPLASALSSLPVQDGIDTSPPPPMHMPAPAPPVAAPKPAAPAMREPAPERPRPMAEPAREPQREPERIRVPDLQRSARPAVQAVQASEPRPAPVAARPTAPGSTPLEMALEGEVARAAAFQATEEGRVLADPVPPMPSKPIAQAVTKHPPVTGNTFGELLRRSLALRPR